MFIQVISGKVVDAEGLTRQLDRWEAELRPGAAGFLGSTSGTTDDGTFVALARFESEAAAEANSERPEQGAWWAETEKNLADVSFENSVEVVTMSGGGSDDATFVQVMKGHVVDAEKMEELRSRMDEFDGPMREFRPDVLGSVIAVHADGTYTDATYFTSETDARMGEQKEMPPDVAALFGDMMAAIEIDQFLDLRHPHFT